MGIKHPESVNLIVQLLGRHVITETVVEQKRRHTRKLEKPLLDADQVRRILSPERKNQIIWRGNARPMMLRTAPYYEYLPSWYHDPDKRYREKLRHRIWRPWFRKTFKPPFTIPAEAPPEPPKPPATPPGGPSAGEAPPGPAPGKPPASPEPENGEKPPSAPEAPESPKLPPKVRDGEQSWSEYLAEEREEADPPRPEPVALTEKGSGAIEQLRALVGLGGVKNRVEELTHLVRLQQRRRRFGMKDLSLSHHLVFTGNPGTGKTTVARIVGQIYKDLGVLKSGHVVEVGRSDLVAGYVGQTAPKTGKVIEGALDGVLFIDEAYSLTLGKGNQDFGYEAVEKLLTEMENNRHRLAVIVAGYPKEMDEFIGSNPGLKSRFKNVIEFADYEASELAEIFEFMCSEVDCRLSREAKQELLPRMEAVKAEAKADFGNARVVRNLVEECITRQAIRLATRKRLTRTDVTMIEAEDLPGDAVEQPPGDPSPSAPARGREEREENSTETTPEKASEKQRPRERPRKSFKEMSEADVVARLSQPVPGYPPPSGDLVEAFHAWFDRQDPGTPPADFLFSPDASAAFSQTGKDGKAEESSARGGRSPIIRKVGDGSNRGRMEDGDQSEDGAFDVNSLMKRIGLSKKEPIVRPKIEITKKKARDADGNDE